MSVQIVQFRADSQRVGEVDEAIRKLFSALEVVAPAGIDYAAARVGDSSEYVLTLALADDAANPLLEIPEAGAFRRKIGEWAGGPVPPETLHVLGRYTA